MSTGGAGPSGIQEGFVHWRFLLASNSSSLGGENTYCSPGSSENTQQISVNSGQQQNWLLPSCCILMPITQMPIIFLAHLFIPCHPSQRLMITPLWTELPSNPLQASDSFSQFQFRQPSLRHPSASAGTCTKSNFPCRPTT